MRSDIYLNDVVGLGCGATVPMLRAAIDPGVGGWAGTVTEGRRCRGQWDYASESKAARKVSWKTILRRRTWLRRDLPRTRGHPASRARSQRNPSAPERIPRKFPGVSTVHRHRFCAVVKSRGGRKDLERSRNCRISGLHDYS